MLRHPVVPFSHWHPMEVAHVEELVAVGEVADPVLLLCGRPVPTAWWTPSLHDLDDADVAALLAEHAGALHADGLCDPTTGRLRGLLGEVEDVVATASVTVLLHTRDGGGRSARRSVVAAPDRALFDVHGDGVHDLLLASPAAAVRLLATFLGPAGGPGGPVRDLAGRRTPQEVADVLPRCERTSTTWLTHTEVGTDGVRVLTLVEHPAGSVVCWATPDGSVEVQPLDEPTAVDLARWLLRASVRDQLDPDAVVPA